MGEAVYGSVSSQRFLMWLLTLFASVALLLGVVGVYSVLSYSVSQRIPEIGVRMALGAGRADVLKLIVGQGTILVGLGLLAGLAGALGLGQFMSGLLFEVSPNDPLAYLSATGLLALAALLACYLPAQRASRFDPLKSLRCE